MVNPYLKLVAAAALCIWAHLSLAFGDDTAAIPSHPSTRRDSGSVGRGDHFQNRRFAFYGRVIDQHNNPVRESTIRLVVGMQDPSVLPLRSRHVKPEFLDDIVDKEITATTDEAGEFSLEDQIGISVKVTDISAVGCYWDPAYGGAGRNGQTTFFSAAQLLGEESAADRRHPAIFAVWRRVEDELVLRCHKGFTLRDVPLKLDLLRCGDPEGSKTPDVSIVVRSEQAQPGSPASWSFAIEAIDGDIQETMDPYPFEAKENGYKRTCSYTMDATDGNWKAPLMKSFYVRSRRGRVYSAIRIEASSPFSRGRSRISSEWVSNPTGSRCLQVEATMPTLSEDDAARVLKMNEAQLAQFREGSTLLKWRRTLQTGATTKPGTAPAQGYSEDGTAFPDVGDWTCKPPDLPFADWLGKSLSELQQRNHEIGLPPFKIVNAKQSADAVAKTLRPFADWEDVLKQRRESYEWYVLDYRKIAAVGLKLRDGRICGVGHFLSSLDGVRFKNLVVRLSAKPEKKRLTSNSYEGVEGIFTESDPACNVILLRPASPDRSDPASDATFRAFIGFELPSKIASSPATTSVDPQEQSH